MNRLRIAFALLPLLLAGCVSLSGPDEPTDTYTLSTTWASTHPAATPLDTSVGVNVPRANGLLDSRAILVSPAADQLRVYAGARWAERPAWLVRQQLLAALADAGAQHAIPSDSGALTHYILESDLDAFRAVTAGEAKHGHVQVILQVRLVDSESRTLIAQRRFSAGQRVDSMQADAIVAGLNAASRRLTRKVARWTVAQLRHRTMAAADSP